MWSLLLGHLRRRSVYPPRTARALTTSATAKTTVAFADPSVAVGYAYLMLILACSALRRFPDLSAVR